MGRPTKLDEQTQRLILVGIRLGLTYSDAAQAAGIHRSTFHRWIAKGNKARRGKFCDFCDTLSRVNAEAQMVTAKVVHDAAKGGQPIKETRTVIRADGSQEITVTEKVSQPDWRAAALILERRFPESWGRRDSLKVEVDWRQELTQIGVDPDEAVNQAVEVLRTLRSDETSNIDSGHEAITI